MFNDCIVMAGGSGTRLWPASNSRRPKQFLPLSAAHPSRTFFSETLRRALAIVSGPAVCPGRVIIIAGKGHVPHVISACAAFERGDRDRMLLIVEPEAKNTAPAIACGLRFAELGASPRSVMVLPSDHLIKPLEAFLEDAALAEILSRQDKLVVFGVVPGGPETGYGYIEAGEALPRSAPSGKSGARAARSFREKPSRAQAEEYLATGRFYWNSGIFAFSSSFMLDEFRRHAPEVLSPFEELEAPGPVAWRVEEGLRILDDWPGFAGAYARTRAVSVDYAIAENCGSVALIPAGFSWTDMGNWDEYARLLGETGAEVYRAGSQNCFVDSDIPVALCGVEDLIVSVRSGKDGGAPSVLIAKKGNTQRIGDLVEQIRSAGRTALL